MGRRPGTPKSPNSGKLFKEGNPGGPGRKPVPQDVREARKLTQVELERILNKLTDKPLKELQEIRANPKTPSLEALICSIIIFGIVKGDQFRLDFLLSRLVGKVSNKVEHSGSLSLESLVCGNEANGDKE